MNQTSHTQGITSVILIILFTASMTACDDTDHTPPPAIPLLQSTNTWPIFRGDQSLSGVAQTTLADQLRLKWEYQTNDAVISSAVIDNINVYIGSNDGHLYALSIADGSLAWKFPADSADQTYLAAIEAPPLLINNTIYVGSSDGCMYALAALDGTLKWKFQTDDQIIGSANFTLAPFTQAPDDDNITWLIFGSFDENIYCLDADTGTEIWTISSGSYINGTPAIQGDTLVYGGCDGYIHCISLKRQQVINSINLENPIPASAALVGNHAYLGHYGNDFLCVNLTTSKIIWTYHDRSSPYFSSPAVDAGRVIFGGRDKRVHCVERATGEPIWEFSTRGKVDSSPVICSDKVIVGSNDGRLYMLRLSDGTRLWQYDLGDAITSSPAIANGLVVIGCEDGKVYAFTSRPENP